MGSKRKIAGKLVDYMLANTPSAKYVYDLFGGGGAMSFEFMQRPQIESVHYNELNTGVVELLRKIMADGVTDEFYRWVTRDEFNEVKKGDDWRAGLIKTCWSFGNNQRTYLFGKSIEADKELLHRIVVDKCVKSLDAFNAKHGELINRDVFEIETIKERRIFVCRETKKTGNRVGVEHLGRLQKLQRLERLQKLQRLERLSISNQSAFDVQIDTPTHESIVYLDPPYKGTEEYAEKMCHNELSAFIDTLTERGYKVYMSSYESPLNEVYQLSHRCNFKNAIVSKVTERLFCNVVESNASQLF